MNKNWNQWKTTVLAVAVLAPLLVSGRLASAAERLYSVAEPLPSDRLDAAHERELDAALTRIKSELPRVNMVGYFVSTSTRPADWKALLDVTARHGMRATIGFVEFKGNAGEDGHQGYRPVKQGGQWQLGPLGELVSDPLLSRHPALYALMYLDEPWHPQKRPVYTTADLKELYRALKARLPAGADAPLAVNFSRQLWRVASRTRNSAIYWDKGICDIVQISGLEFQNGRYKTIFWRRTMKPRGA